MLSVLTCQKLTRGCLSKCDHRAEYFDRAGLSRDELCGTNRPDMEALRRPPGQPHENRQHQALRNQEGCLRLRRSHGVQYWYFRECLEHGYEAVEVQRD